MKERLIEYIEFYLFLNVLLNLPLTFAILLIGSHFSEKEM